MSYVDLELPGTRQIFSRETQFLRPRFILAILYLILVGHESIKIPLSYEPFGSGPIECCYFKDNENVSGSGYGFWFFWGP